MALLGWNQTPWAVNDFATVVATQSFGFQVGLISKKPLAVQTTGVIDSEKDFALQASAQIEAVSEYGMQTTGNINSQDEFGFQTQQEITSGNKPAAMQSNGLINGQKNFGMEAEGQIESSKSSAFQVQLQASESKYLGFQVDLKTDGLKPLASEVKIGKLIHVTGSLWCVTGWGELAWCSDNYRFDVLFPMQVDAVVGGAKEFGMQVEARIDSYKNLGMESEGLINFQKYQGQQSQARIDSYKYLGSEVEGRIDAYKYLGMQAESRIDAVKPSAFQVDSVRVFSTGMQARVALYNTHNLRILCQFPSRGTSGTNWTSTSTQAGDFSVDNLNTDIVEQYWRTATGVKVVNLDCDTQIVQGIFLDTLAILNHNLTSSAIVTLIGSNAPDFSNPVQISLTVERNNMYYVAPELPLTSYRYWRLDIQDTTNTDNFLRIGTVVFGTAVIFQGECFVDEITTGKINFTDGINTEGFTTVKNDRALKRFVNLTFRSLNLEKRNYENIQEIFDYARTTLKCLWVPTPNYPSRYALFSKLVELPEEVHNSKAENLTYVDFSIALDESK